MSQTHFSSLASSPQALAAAPSGPAWLAFLRRGLQRVDGWFASPLSAQQLVLRLSVYLVLAANWPLWLQLVQIGGAPSIYLRSVAEMALLIVCGMVALLAFTAWTRGMRLLWWLVLLVAALAQYYMLTYSVVMDPGMAANVLQTDAREAADLLSPRLLGAVLAVMVLPTWWLVRVRIPPMRPLRQLGRNLALLALALAVAAGMVALNARHLAPLMRNHPQLRYLMNPLASGAPRPVGMAIADHLFPREDGPGAGRIPLVGIVGHAAQVLHRGRQSEFVSGTR